MTSRDGPTGLGSPLLTVSEAADRLGVSVETVRRWSRDGALPALRTPGGHRRYRPADLDAVIRPDRPAQPVTAA